VRGPEYACSPSRALQVVGSQGWHIGNFSAPEVSSLEVKDEYLYLLCTNRTLLTPFSAHELLAASLESHQLHQQNSIMLPNRLHSPSRLLFITCATLVRLACAQECYYPNGNPTLEPDEPCNDGTGNCCPLNWECLNNGLCYLPNQGYLQRTTCMRLAHLSSFQPANNEPNRYR